MPKLNFILLDSIIVLLRMKCLIRSQQQPLHCCDSSRNFCAILQRRNYSPVLIVTALVGILIGEARYTARAPYPNSVSEANFASHTLQRKLTLSTRTTKTDIKALTETVSAHSTHTYAIRISSRYWSASLLFDWLKISHSRLFYKSGTPSRFSARR